MDTAHIHSTRAQHTDMDTAHVHSTRDVYVCQQTRHHFPDHFPHSGKLYGMTHPAVYDSPLTLHVPRAVLDLGAPADRVPVGACDPML